MGAEGGRWTVEPIGFVRCGERYRFETPRQGAFAANSGAIELCRGCRYEQAAADLAGFSRIWVIFLFHLNQNWNVMVTPPVAPPGRKIGVLATRSPHRPNRIGMSCVELERVEGRLLRIRNFDMLDATPVLDVKPYIPAADSFPDAAVGWLAAAEAETYSVDFAPALRAKNAFIAAGGGPDLENFCRVQLSLAPLDRSRKRLFPLPGGDWEIGCRTWRVRFAVDAPHRRVTALDVRSNFRPDELRPGAVDRYGDLELHRAFAVRFPDGETVQERDAETG